MQIVLPVMHRSGFANQMYREESSIRQAALTVSAVTILMAKCTAHTVQQHYFNHIQLRRKICIISELLSAQAAMVKQLKSIVKLQKNSRYQPALFAMQPLCTVPLARGRVSFRSSL